MRRISYMSDSCWKNTSFSPQEQNSFAQNQLMSYFSEKKHYCPLKMISIEAESHFLSKLIRRITALPWRHNICLGRVSVSESPHESFFPSFKNEIFFKLIVLHKRLNLLGWRITFKSILADKVFVLFWGLNILLRRIFCLYWVCWVIERIDLPLTQ